jgi:integrase
LLEVQIAPHLGAILLQKLRMDAAETWHVTLKTSGRKDGGALSTRTIRHAHRVLGKALKDAARLGLVVRNVLAEQSPPKVAETEMAIVRDVPGFIALIRGDPMFVPGMIALLTGMRLGEVLALAWNRINLDRGILEVRQAIVQTRKGIKLGPPKTGAGRRDISMPDLLVEVLRTYRKEQLELRMKLGAGKLPDDVLLFARPNGELPSQKRASQLWANLADRIRHPEITFHGLRHTHASQLIHEGVDIVTISKRLGHAKPDITLRTYAHLFKLDDNKAAAAINKALAQ